VVPAVLSNEKIHLNLAILMQVVCLFEYVPSSPMKPLLNSFLNSVDHRVVVMLSHCYCLSWGCSVL
jgi:hypothetical protein